MTSGSIGVAFLIELKRLLATKGILDSKITIKITVDGAERANKIKALIEDTIGPASGIYSTGGLTQIMGFNFELWTAKTEEERIL